jgi:hypothetical protein
MRSFRKLALIAALCSAAALNAQTFGNASTFAGLTWDFSSSAPGLESCTLLVLDVTGAVGASNNYSAYGQVFCPALGGSYASSGNAYFDSFSNFHMTVSMGVTYQLVCDNLSGGSLSGSCPVYDYLGNQVGSAFVSFL